MITDQANLPAFSIMAAESPSRQTIDYDKFYEKACHEFTGELSRNPLVLEVIVKGSLNDTSRKVPFWSDMDISVVVESVRSKVYCDLSELCKSFEKRYPEISLSLTIINKNDTPKENPLHHHGIKPLAYNFELCQQTNSLSFTKIPDISVYAIQMSSIYRYYEILYDLRKNNLSNTMPAYKFVARAFHRISRFVRTQVEILDPNLVLHEGKVDEVKYAPIYNLSEVGDFFVVRDHAKRFWPNIMRDDSLLEKYNSFLVNKLEDLHESFLPRLIEIGKRYSQDDDFSGRA